MLDTRLQMMDARLQQAGRKRFTTKTVKFNGTLLEKAELEKVLAKPKHDANVGH